MRTRVALLCAAGAQNFCQLCEGQGTLASGLLQLYRPTECVACLGAGMIVGDQFPCRKCGSTGVEKDGKAPCELCEGRRLLTFDHAKCAGCGGEGTVGGWFSSADCDQCHRKGYFPVAPKQSKGGRPQARRKRAQPEADRAGGPGAGAEAVGADGEQASSDEPGDAGCSLCNRWTPLVGLALYFVLYLYGFIPQGLAPL